MKQKVTAIVRSSKEIAAGIMEAKVMSDPFEDCQAITFWRLKLSPTDAVFLATVRSTMINGSS